jgi:S-adenosylmethionine hydrolase
MTENTLSKTIRNFMKKHGRDAGVFAVAHALVTEGQELAVTGDRSEKKAGRKLRSIGNRLYKDAPEITEIDIADMLKRMVGPIKNPNSKRR